jgi:hypothetical protein
MSRIEMRWICASFILGLHLIKIFEFFESMFIDSTDWFGEISVHLVISNIKIDIIIVNDPGEDRIL